MIRIFQKAQIKLTIIYVAIIGFIVILFSVSLYQASVPELARLSDRQLINLERRYEAQTGLEVDQSSMSQARQLLITEARQKLVNRIIFVDIIIFISTWIFSYFLARKTLKPIEEAHQAQLRFSSDASHELKTPLTAIRTEIEVALVDPKLNLEDAKEVLKSNLQEVETMTSMISRLLELSKIREGESITKEVDVAIEKVISTAIKTVNNSAKSKNITIVKKDVSKSLLTINSGVIQQVLTIILDNAIKYSPTNSSIIIVGKKSIINSCYQIMVSDHGPGVPKNQKTQIFQRFHQVDSSRSKKNNSGQGLGLAISKELLLKHGGSVELTKSSSKGSTFTIELPF